MSFIELTNNFIINGDIIGYLNRGKQSGVDRWWIEIYMVNSEMCKMFEFRDENKADEMFEKLKRRVLVQ